MARVLVPANIAAMEDDEFDPAQFTMERLTRNTNSLRVRATVPVQNQPHDEEVAVSESESLASPSDAASHRGAMESPLHYEAAGSMGSEPASPGQQQQYGSTQSSPLASPSAATSHPQDLPGEYDPNDYASLPVTEDVQDIFKYIGRYRPAPLEQLPMRLMPFIPEYIPAIGGTDEFIKVPRPDGQPDYLGLKVLDEPAPVQSDPTLLNLQLRTHGKEAAGVKMQLLGSIPHHAPDRQQRLATWISSIADLHKSRPSAAVSYSRPMPDVELLMQEWPPALEAALHASRLPTADLDLDLLSFAKLVCALLDVPVHSDGTVIESMHLLFTLYLSFKNNPYFRTQGSSCGSGSWPLSTASAQFS